MDFSLLYQLKNRSWWTEAFFYFSVVSLTVAVLTYAVFAYKYYLQDQKISEINEKIAVYGTVQQKEREKEVLDYRKKVDDFSAILNNQKFFSNALVFMEKNTLSNVSFSFFDITESLSEIRLSGETDNMSSLSRQIQVFEENKDYVKSINVLNSQLGASGVIKFVLNVSLRPQIFSADFSFEK